MLTPKERIEEICIDNEIDCVTLDGYDDAIIGTYIDVSGNGLHAVYDESKIISKLVDSFKDSDLYKTYEDLVDMAIEYYDYNVVRSLPYIDEVKRPIIIQKI